MRITNLLVNKYKEGLKPHWANYKLGIVLASLTVLSGCQSFPSAINSTLDHGEERSLVNTDAAFNSVRELVRASFNAIEQGKLKKASNLMNLALKLDITNPDLQFYNGLIYHLMGVAGDASKYELAEQGYRRALKFDPGNLATQYQLGLLYMDQRRYVSAQEKFASVALHYDDDPDALFSLAAASYYARDPQTAEAALKRLMQVSPETSGKREVIKAIALSRAAMNDREGVVTSLADYRKIEPSKDNIQRLQRRVNSWYSFYDSDVSHLLAQADSGYSDGNQDSTSYEERETEASETDLDDGEDSNMVVVDVVIIGTQEDVRDSSGINLLNGLQLMFGDLLAGTPGFSKARNRVIDTLNSGLAESTRTLTRQIGIPAVTYSLNIANSLNANNKVLARPSLVAESGETSEFFSGTEVLAAAVSGGDGDSVSVEKEVGVKLAVTPEVLGGGEIRLHVVAERTFLTDPSTSVVFEFRLDTTKTNVNSTVTMKYGETLILGGLSERETSSSKDGVPGLMDVPIVKYLFSQNTVREFERSVLILMTPRRPQYTKRDEKDRDRSKRGLSELERNIERLSRRHKDWFTPHPTFNQVMEKIKGKEFFEEFRIGDIKINSWHKSVNDLNHVAMVRSRLLRN